MLKLSLAVGTLFLVLHSNVASAQGASIGGRVVNAQGTVIANADITLRSIPPAGMPARMPMPGQDNGERTTQSRADGTFSFTQVAPGQYVLFADRTGFERSSEQIDVASQPLTVAFVLEPLEVPGADAHVEEAAAPADAQQLLNRIKELEQRLSDLESGTVLSEPETRVKRIEVYVDQNGNEHDAAGRRARRRKSPTSASACIAGRG